VVAKRHPTSMAGAAEIRQSPVRIWAEA
jgi:hypothetical protein